MMDLLWGFVFLGLIAVYLLPAIIAGCRETKNALGITLLTLLLGWTMLGWIGALIWATCDTPKEAKHVNA